MTKIVYRTDMMGNADKAIDVASGSWQKTQRDIQVALVATVYCQYRDNDRGTTVERINRLIECTQGVNTKAITEWFVRMGFNFTKEGLDKSGIPTKAELGATVGKEFKNAKELLWHGLKPIKPFDEFDEVKAVNSLISKMKTKIELKEKLLNSEDSDDLAKAELINATQETLNKLRGVLAAA